MDNPIKYIVKPSLQDISLVQIAVAMWKHANFRDPILKNLRSEYDLRSSNINVFFNIAPRIIENVKQLKQPEHLKEKIRFYITFIGLEIRRSVDFHCSYLKSLVKQSAIYLPDEFYFTPHGIIDRKKTSEMIVKNKYLDIRQRYAFSCIYCLRDDILKLWNEMTEDCQELIFKNYLLDRELYQKEDYGGEYDEEEVSEEDFREEYDEEAVNREEYDEEEEFQKDCDDGEVILKEYEEKGVLEEEFREEYDEKEVSQVNCDEEEVSSEEYDEEEVFEEDFREEYDEEEVTRKGYDVEDVSQDNGLLHEVFLENNYADIEEKLQNQCYNEDMFTRNMVCIWTLAMKKEQLDYTLPFPYLLDILQCSARVKNKAAFEYFLQGLKEQNSLERELIRAAKYIYKEPDPDYLCFLLSKMTEEQQLEVFKDDPCEVLVCFLKWRFETFFMETADRMWDFFSPESFQSLLRAIIDYSTELFEEFWQKCPNGVKRCIINADYTLALLTNEKDRKNAGFILRGTAAIEKIELNECDRAQTLCKHFLSLHDWSSMKFLIKKYLVEGRWSSQALKFKKEFENYIISTNLNKYFVTHKPKWDQIFEELLHVSKKWFDDICR